MKVISLSETKEKAKEELIQDIANDLREATNFIVITSNDNLTMISDRYFNISHLEIIGLLDSVKHQLLHGVFPDDDDGNREDIAAEGGL